MNHLSNTGSPGAITEARRVRYGGLADLVSIDVADQRERVSVRFAVIRRARQIARWL